MVFIECISLLVIQESTVSVTTMNVTQGLVKFVQMCHCFLLLLICDYVGYFFKTYTLWGPSICIFSFHFATSAVTGCYHCSLLFFFEFWIQLYDSYSSI